MLLKGLRRMMCRLRMHLQLFLIGTKLMTCLQELHLIIKNCIYDVAVKIASNVSKRNVFTDVFKWNCKNCI
jgi:hypothetical protein